mmetsp:Transcript_76277/g.147306  ORF Transcript_76277/g.147306 Transcript_76277/m.147306 type:complete len:230 (-) Transcript_76277:193-882(-)
MQIFGSASAELAKRWRQLSSAARGVAPTSMLPCAPEDSSLESTANNDRREYRKPCLPPACAAQRFTAAVKPSPTGIVLPISTFATTNASCLWLIATTLPSPGGRKSTKGTASPVANGSLLSKSLMNAATSDKGTGEPLKVGGEAVQCCATGEKTAISTPGSFVSAPALPANAAGLVVQRCICRTPHCEKPAHMNHVGCPFTCTRDGFADGIAGTTGCIVGLAAAGGAPV